MNLEKVETHARLCAICRKMCRHVCTTHAVTRNEADTPNERAFVAYEALKRGHFLPSEVDQMYEKCATCGACLASCAPDLDAGIVMLYAMDQNALAMLRTPLPGTKTGLMAFFLVGGLIGPLAEEICFRGLVYTFFRRWGIVAAVIASTLVFVVLHSVHGFPLVQIIGGLIFAISFELTRNLMVPIVIHVLGNCAIFALSLPWLTG